LSVGKNAKELRGPMPIKIIASVVGKKKEENEHEKNQ